MTSVSPFSPAFLGILVLGPSLAMMGGCDAVPGLESGEHQSPRVSNLRVAPDSIHVSEADSLAQLTIDLSVRAADPDGSVERVVFLLEPASSPRATVSGDLQSVSGSLYGGRIQFTVPLVEELFTVRAFAVDNDSLTSNRVTGQFRFEPSKSSVTTAGARSNAPSVPFSQQPPDFTFEALLESNGTGLVNRPDFSFVAPLESNGASEVESAQRLEPRSSSSDNIKPPTEALMLVSL